MSTVAVARPRATPHVLPRVLFLVGLGAFFTVLGLPLIGSTWIDPAGITAGGVALALTAVSTRTTLDAIVVLTPFMFRVLTPVGVLNLGTSDVLLPVIVVLLVTRGIVERAPRRDALPVARRGALNGAGAGLVLGLFATVLLTGSLTVWAVVSRDFFLTRAISDTAKVGVGVVYLVLVVVLTRRAGRREALRAMTLWTWVATGVAGAAVAGGATGLPLVPNDGYRSLGFFADPNLFAAYLLLSLAILVFRSTVRSTPWLLVQAVVVAAGVITSGSRGGLLTMALLVAFSALIVNSARLRLAIVALTALGTGVALTILQSSDGGSNVLGVDRLLVSTSESGDDARFQLWALALRLWADHPVLGIGMGQYQRFSVGIVGEDASAQLGHVVHNSFLSVLVALGVVGLALFLGMFVWVLATVYRSPGLTRNNKHALTAGVLVIVAQMMTLNLENLRYVWVYLGLAVGLALVSSAPAPRPPTSPQEVPHGPQVRP